MARAGRPSKLNDRMERAILRVVRDNPRQSAVKMNRQLKIDQEVEVSDQTVRRSIKRHWYNNRIARKKPLLRPVNVQKRLEYAKKYENIHVSDPTFWERVIFTDDCKFMVFGGHGRANVWRKTNKEFLTENVNPTVKHGGGSVMV